MNKLFKRCMALVLGLAMAAGASAQEMPQLPPLPADPAVRIGQLPNGLTYYIRHNENPKGQADFYIAQKVGSILEEENQRGLAHFLEHMCFNGTENFPEKGIINYLESIGVRFGYNLNAYTSVDETVYNISSVPVARKSVQDSCLLILHDWACALTLDPKEIDAERGVIHEEWRRSMAGQMRILENLLPVIYPDNKYGERLPIGIMEVVDNFPPQALVDYYHTWYRPDQQGIIVVGDIDVDYIEGKIKEIFSPIKMPENAKERYYVPVADTEGTIYAVGSDPEQTAPIAFMFFKTDKLIPKELRNTQAFYPVHYMTSIVSSMLNHRLSDLASKPDAPFAQASVDIEDFFFAKTKDALTIQVIGKDADLTGALQAVYREVLRAAQGGFTPGEFERANAEIRARYQNLYDSRNDVPTDSYSREYVRAFVDNEPIPGIEVEKQLMDAMTQMIPLEQVNMLLPQLITPDNRVVLMMLPEAEGFSNPTDAQIAAAITAVEGETLEPYRDEMKSEPLLPALPAPGKVVSKEHNAQWDATVFTLSNGVKVFVKPTTFKENDIQFTAIAKGGYSTLGDDKAASIIFMPYSLGYHGLGEYTKSDLAKYLQGKQVSVNLDFSPYTRNVTGASTVQDLPTLMELIYANFTEFNMFPDEFQAAQNMFKGVLANQEATPDYAFSSLIHSTLYQAPAMQVLSTAVIEAADSEVTDGIVKEMLANAADFNFYFVGNIDMDTFVPLMEQYIATLPTAPVKPADMSNPAFAPKRGTETVEKSMAMTTPQTWAFYYISGNEEFTPANKVMITMISQILGNRLLNKVREEMGATYSIGAGGNLSRVSPVNTVVQIPFPMKPEMRQEVFDAINVILDGMGTEITADELNRVKEYLTKEAVSDAEENTGWIGAMAASSLNGVDNFNGITDVIANITADDLTALWRQLRSQNNFQLILLNPAE